MSEPIRTEATEAEDAAAKRPKIRDLRMTCEACPSQWEGTLDDGRKIYVRYRWGTLQIGFGATMDDAVDATFLADVGERYMSERIGDEYDGIISRGKMLAAAGLEMVR